MTALFTLPGSVVQVMNSRTSMVHLWAHAPSVVCGAWKAGSPEKPVTTAAFAGNSDYWVASTASCYFCALCYSVNGMAKCNGVLRNGSKDVEVKDDDCDSSDVSASSCSDAEAPPS